jgi:hypothetical protein
VGEGEAEQVGEGRGGVEVGEVFGSEGREGEAEAREVDPLPRAEAAAATVWCLEVHLDPARGHCGDPAGELPVVDGDGLTGGDAIEGFGMADGYGRGSGGLGAPGFWSTQEADALARCKAELAFEVTDAETGAGEVEEDATAPWLRLAEAFEFEFGVADRFGEVAPFGGGAVGGVDAGNVHPCAEELHGVEDGVAHALIEGDHDAGRATCAGPPEEVDGAALEDAQGLGTRGGKPVRFGAFEPGEDARDGIEHVRFEASEGAEPEVGERDLELGEVAGAQGAVGEEIGRAERGIAGQPGRDALGSVDRLVVSEAKVAKEGAALHTPGR